MQLIVKLLSALQGKKGEIIGKTLPIGIVCANNHFITKYHLSERIIITQHHYHNHVHYYYVVSCILLVYHLKEYAHV